MNDKSSLKVNSNITYFKYWYIIIQLPDMESIRCCICQEGLRQPIAKPDCCPHLFCRECLQKWLKQRNTCPLDRYVVKIINIMNNLDGPVIEAVCQILIFSNASFLLVIFFLRFQFLRHLKRRVHMSCFVRCYFLIPKMSLNQQCLKLLRI